VPGFWDPHIASPSRFQRSAQPALPDRGRLSAFHFALPDGTLSGFDVDLSRAICEELKITCTIQARRYDTLIDALNSDQGDALMAATASIRKRALRSIFPGRTIPLRHVSWPYPASLRSPQRRKACAEKPSALRQKLRMKPISKLFSDTSANLTTHKSCCARLSLK